MLDNSFGAGKHAFALLGKDRSKTQQYLFDNLGRQIWALKAQLCVINEKEVLKVSMDNVYHNNLISNLWSCNAEIELQVMNERCETVTKTMEHCFNSRSRRLDFGEITARDYILPENMYQYAKCLFVVNIKINELVGIGAPLSNFASSQELDPANSEVILAVGDQKLYVDKYGLMGCSSLFYEMFNKDMDMKTLEIQDASITHFLAFIRLIYEQEQQITLENVKHLLELAVRYDVAFLIEECMQFLVSNENISSSEKRRLVELHKLTAFEEEALKHQKAFHEDTVKVMEPLKENAAAHLKVLLEAKEVLKKVEQEMERAVEKAETRLEILKVLQTAKPLGSREQEILSAFRSSFPPLKSEVNCWANSHHFCWSYVRRHGTNEYDSRSFHAPTIKKNLSKILESLEKPSFDKDFTFPQFVHMLQSEHEYDMIRHFCKITAEEEAKEKAKQSEK